MTGPLDQFATEIDKMTFDRRAFMGLAGALLVSACASRQIGPPRGATDFDWVLRPPEEAGMTRSGIEGIRATVQKLVDDGSVSGVVSAIARRNKLVWYEAQGYRDPVSRTPMPRDGIFRIMSSTKPVTAVAVLMMLEEGRLSLDDEVSRFIPSWKNQKVAVAPPGATDASQVSLVPLEREVTIRHLLTHTSGITNIGVALPGAPTPGSLVNRISLTADDDLASYIPRLGSAALDFQPGTKFSYSPTEAPDAALRIVEIVSGQPADIFLRERLFQPLEMHDTYFNVPAEKQGRIVDIFGKVDGEWQIRDHLFGPPPYKYLSGGGGLFGTVHDLLNFELMLLNKGSFNGRRILRPESVDLMTSDHAGQLFREWIPFLTRGYDFGLMVRVARDEDNAKDESVGSFGWGGAYGTESWAEPALDLAAVFFLQMNPPSMNGANLFGKAMREAIIA